jgi:hypothetical protein
MNTRSRSRFTNASRVFFSMKLFFFAIPERTNVRALLSFRDWKPSPQGQVRDHWLCLEKQKASESEAQNLKSKIIPENVQNPKHPNNRRICHRDDGFV